MCTLHIFVSSYYFLSKALQQLPILLKIRFLMLAYIAWLLSISDSSYHSPLHVLCSSHTSLSVSQIHQVLFCSEAFAQAQVRMFYVLMCLWLALSSHQEFTLNVLVSGSSSLNSPSEIAIQSHCITLFQFST